VTLLPEGLYSPPIAHRGLWSADGFPENSLAAIERACQAGYGVEFDVRLSSDGEAMVFHDATLERMTALEGPVSALSARELASTPLTGGPDGIPSLGQVLGQVRGRAMLLIELKAGGDTEALAARTAQLLRSYRHPFAVISFEAQALAWFLRRWPDVPRGLDAYWTRPGEAEAAERLERDCALAEPHFLVLGLEAAAGPTAAARRAQGQPVIAWTVRSGKDADTVGEHCDNFIFEGFTA
jgi:glycerophosphoryl diester phosphodiesterase